MTKSDLAAILDSWEKALKTLGEALVLEETAIVRDAAIKRFEYNFELAWKTIKQFALAEGLDCDSPKSAFKEAFKLGWINDSEIWLNMLDDRNQTTHTYKEATVQLIYRNLPEYLSAFQSLYNILKAKTLVP